MSITDAQWTVDTNEDGTGVIIEFGHFNKDGVESFCTSMPPKEALDFARAVFDAACELSE